ncbi:MAG: hypothetical protein AB1489_04350 [Acidobacteriota bacterium]
MRFEIDARVLYKGCEFCAGRVVDIQQDEHGHLHYLISFDDESATDSDLRWCDEYELEPFSTKA